MNPDNYPFGQTHYKNYDPEQVNTPQDVAELFEWIANENFKESNDVAAMTFAECAEVVRNQLVEGDNQDVSNDALDGPILDGQEVSKGYRRGDNENS